MQGFNMGRHRPYDSDPTKQSFNSHSNKHPLGDRARKLDKGILIVRFENPFNIWCTSCNGHIAQGVRFNAEKSKVGNYLSTPIWNFRCKCHLCQNWFEIRTDPKNTQYICHSGSRRKVEDWDPEEEGNGAFIADTEAGLERAPYSLKSGSSTSSDPFSNLETSKKSKSRKDELDSRLSELEAFSSSRNSDPFTLNSKLRDISRESRHEAIRKEMKKDDLRNRIGWRNDFHLQDEDPDLGRSEWLEEKDQAEMHEKSRPKVSSTSDCFSNPEKSKSSRKKSSSSSSSSIVRGSKASIMAPKSRSTLPSRPSLSLASRLLENTRKKRDPFGLASSSTKR